ncbi:MAG: hypothetical protein IJC19_05395 [Clostridia bacterium]|nr:hypothetical protein [Clostridia bacterium]
MKKSISLILVFLLLFALGACSKPMQEMSTDRSVPNPTVTGNMTYTIYNYHPMGTSSTTGTVGADWEQTLVKELSNLQKTGEKQEVLAEHYRRLKSSVLCIETNNRIYRYTNNTLALVSDHLGEGELLELSDELKSTLRDVLYYYPFNTYHGTYENSKITLKHVFSAETTIDISITDMGMNKDQGFINLQIISAIDQELTVHLSSETGGCFVGSGDRKDLQLKAEEPQNILLTFTEAQDGSFYIKIVADKTLYKISIPR